MKMLPRFLDPYIPVTAGDIDHVLAPTRAVDTNNIDKVVAAIEKDRNLKPGQLADYQRFLIRRLLK